MKAPYNLRSIPSLRGIGLSGYPSRPPPIWITWRFLSRDVGVGIWGTLGDKDPLNKGPLLREPELGLRRVPFKGSP